MRNFHRIAAGMNFNLLLHEIQRHPELWNENKFRTTYENTPHADVDDIWLRYSSLERCYAEDSTGEVQNDTNVEWFQAKELLPQARPIVLTLMATVGAYSLLRLLVTRIKPGGRILPHADTDGTYVQLNDIARYHCIAQGLPGSKFRCGNEVAEMLTGEIWWFNAALEHEVLNESPDDRIHLIADVRLW